MNDHYTMITGLRGWAASCDAFTRAAVDLLVDHDHWLWDLKFVQRCVHVNDHDVPFINWMAVEQLLKNGQHPASGSELAVLRLALMLARDLFGLSSLDRVNRGHVVDAVAAALDVTR